MRPGPRGPSGRVSGTVLALVLAASLAGCGAATAASPTPTGYHWTGAVLVHPLTKPSFVLTDQQGQPFDFRAGTAGKVTLLYFGYTHCPDICPENMAAIAFALKDVPADVRSRIAVVFVTTDPARDTPPVLRAWLANYNAGFIGLTGTRAQINAAQIEAAVDLASPGPTQTGGGYGVDHAAQVIAYSADNLAHVAFFQGMPASSIARDLDLLVTHPWTGA